MGFDYTHGIHEAYSQYCNDKQLYFLVGSEVMYSIFLYCRGD